MLKNNVYQTKTICRGIILILTVFLFTGIDLFGCKQVNQTSLSNNTIAFAYPVESIITDGDISDWPKETVQYPITEFYKQKPNSEKDFNAYFQVAYNRIKHSLYFAVVVSDESHITDTTENAFWNTQDSYSLYLNIKNKPSGSGVVSYQFNKIWKNLVNPVLSWDPDVKNANWNNVRIACKRKNVSTIYEFSIELKGEIYPGKSIGVDHIIFDRDEEDKKSIGSLFTWGEEKNKDKTTGKLGYIILMSAKENISPISGQVKWKSETINEFPNKIRITSLSNPELWIQIPVDSTGTYSVEIPQGKYIITPVQSYFFYEKPDKDEVYLRIDKENSSAVVTTETKKIVKAPILELKTISLPDLIPEKGILHDFNDEKSKFLDKFIKTYQEYYEIPGVSIALIKKGKVIYHKTYGIKNTYTGESVSKKTLFEAGSVTKPVFAFVVCRLAEKGIVDLDKPLYLDLPFEDIEHDERYKLITARHVLSHQTGFPNWAAGKFDLKFTPGTGYGYSGEGFEYLKRVVEKITQKDIGVILKEEIIEPLNLKNTYFKNDKHLAKEAANGHLDNLPTNIRLPSRPGMAWSMSTEAKSFSDFIIALLNKKGLKPETYKEMLSIQTVIPKDNSEKKTGWDENSYRTLGFRLEKSPYGRILGHGGSTTRGFMCNFDILPDLNMGYIILTNSNTGYFLVSDPIMEFLITGKEKK